MTKLVSISINSIGSDVVERKRYELQADWDNDRHHVVKIRSLDSRDVAYAIREMGVLLYAERANGNLT